MVPDTLRFYGTYFVVFARLAFVSLYQRLESFEHWYTWRETTSTRNVVVIGGSFSGVYLARRLANSLPTGYKVVLIEKNSHFNYLFNFPRYSVVTGHEHKAFIPFDSVTQGAPTGIFQRIQDVATQVRADEVILESGKTVGYDYLAVATGTAQTPPSNLAATGKAEGCKELRSYQGTIRTAQKIAIVGGGAVGVQMAGDIKSVYPEKRVVLIHSRDQLLQSFGSKLHEYVLPVLSRMGVEVLLNERPNLPDVTGMNVGPTAISFKSGCSEDFDLIIPCTGRRSPSTLLSTLSTESISPETGRILVKPTLQIRDDSFPNIFALGDVAETAGAKMARAGMAQAEIVRSNIVSMIKGNQRLRTYTPDPIEGVLKLTLGKSNWVMYLEDRKGRALLYPGTDKTDDLGIKHAWGMFGASTEGWEKDAGDSKEPST